MLKARQSGRHAERALIHGANLTLAKDMVIHVSNLMLRKLKLECATRSHRFLYNDDAFS